MDLYYLLGFVVSTTLGAVAGTIIASEVANGPGVSVREYQTFRAVGGIAGFVSGAVFNHLILECDLGDDISGQFES